MKKVNAIMSLGLGHLIDYNLKDLVDVRIQLSPSMSPSSLPEYDSACRYATEYAPIDSQRPTGLVDPKETKQDEYKYGEDTS